LENAAAFVILLARWTKRPEEVEYLKALAMRAFLFVTRPLHATAPKSPAKVLMLSAKVGRPERSDTTIKRVNKKTAQGDGESLDRVRISDRAWPVNESADAGIVWITLRLETCGSESSAVSNGR
jgi:hypothetical protein